MADKPLVLGGWYTDVKYLNKIGVARITIEMPKDLWEENQGVLGVPPSLDGDKKFVALSRITEEAFKNWASPLARASVPDKSVDAAPAVKAETKRSSRAYLMCRDPQFQKWLETQYDWTVAAGHDAAETTENVLKSILHIISKTELDTIPEAAEAFDRLRTSFELRDLVRA